ncbi:GNAT family N-acetyltransferase [Croceiramulus getboli]|nr:GNAT family N-acetyltransferase [Flavobacteriaceae bacterium YJPT1-3]
MSSLSIKRVYEEDLSATLPLVQQLMGHKISDALLEARFREMLNQNYESFGIYWEEQLVGVFGLWFMTRHYAGKSCEPDHVYISDAHRGKGLGKQVFQWIYTYARGKGCETSELNSYVSNYPSHKFYLNEGYDILGYHFLKKL